MKTLSVYIYFNFYSRSLNQDGCTQLMQNIVAVDMKWVFILGLKFIHISLLLLWSKKDDEIFPCLHVKIYVCPYIMFKMRDAGIQCLVTGRWFSPGIPVSFTNKTGRHDITEMLFQAALNTITLTLQELLTDREHLWITLWFWVGSVKRQSMILLTPEPTSH